MSQPLTYHLWLPSGDSLCARRKHDGATAADDEEHPTCGVCIVIAHALYIDGWYLGADNPAGIWPATPAEAIDLMREGRWSESRIDDLKPYFGDSHHYIYPKRSAERVTTNSRRGK